MTIPITGNPWQMPSSALSPGLVRPGLDLTLRCVCGHWHADHNASTLDCLIPNCMCGTVAHPNSPSGTVGFSEICPQCHHSKEIHNTSINDCSQVLQPGGNQWGQVTGVCGCRLYETPQTVGGS